MPGCGGVGGGGGGAGAGGGRALLKTTLVQKLFDFNALPCTQGLGYRNRNLTIITVKNGLRDNCQWKGHHVM